jgi:membrane protein YqaA with SNARE-associated domain
MEEFFLQYGYIGMALASFLAGTFVPFSSEAVMGALLATTGMNPILTVLSGTLGNVLGSMFNYYLGRIGNIRQICHLMHVKEERLCLTQRYVERRGSWIAFFSFLPAFGTAISISLGLLRANVLGVLLYTFAGKLVRYIIVAYSVLSLK